MKFLLLLFPLFLQGQVPFKPNEEFEIKTDFQFKRKPPTDAATITIVDPGDKVSSTDSGDLLPFVTLKVTVKKFMEGTTSIKVMASSGKQVLRKKAFTDLMFKFEMGYISDIKDGITPNAFEILFLKDKIILERITLKIEEDGTFLVNEITRGKF